MNLKIALATAAVIATATTGVASATDLAAGVYSVTSKVLTATDTGLAGSCSVVSQSVGASSYSFLYYTPATTTAAGSLLQVVLAASGDNVYQIAESVPATKKLVGYQGPSTALRGTTFPLGIANDAGPVGASITLKFTSKTAVTETITYGPYSCSVTSSVKAIAY